MSNTKLKACSLEECGFNAVTFKESLSGLPCDVETVCGVETPEILASDKAKSSLAVLDYYIKQRLDPKVLNNDQVTFTTTIALIWAKAFIEGNPNPELPDLPEEWAEDDDIEMEYALIKELVFG